MFCSEPVTVDSVLAGGGVGVDVGITGEFVAGEFRCCCSSSYSLIKRFFSGCALFEETDVVGDADDETGETMAGGVLPLMLACNGLIGGLLRFDE